MDDEANRFRHLLAAERTRTQLLLSQLRADVAGVRAARHDSNVDEEHDPEGSTIAFELSQASTLVAGAVQRLVEIDAAMLRLDDGSFGLCRVCESPIGQGRLEARPWAPFCIQHASAGG